MDEEQPRKPAAPGLPRPLTTLSIEELSSYAAALRQEVVRVEAEVAKREAVRRDADALFRRPTRE